MQPKQPYATPLYSLFEFFMVEHDLVLTDAEIADIIAAVSQHLRAADEADHLYQYRGTCDECLRSTWVEDYDVDTKTYATFCSDCSWSIVGVKHTTSPL